MLSHFQPTAESTTKDFSGIASPLFRLWQNFNHDRCTRLASWRNASITMIWVGCFFRRLWPLVCTTCRCITSYAFFFFFLFLWQLQCQSYGTKCTNHLSRLFLFVPGWQINCKKWHRVKNISGSEFERLKKRES